MSSGLKWEMMPPCSVQSPGLEISIWVMAHKHLPDCVQPSAGMSSDVMEVIRFTQEGPASLFVYVALPLICVNEKKHLMVPQIFLRCFATNYMPFNLKCLCGDAHALFFRGAKTENNF